MMSSEAQLVTVAPLYCAPHPLLVCPPPGGRMAAELPGSHSDNVVCLAQEWGNLSQKCPRECLLVSLTRIESHGFSWTHHWQGEWGYDGNQPSWNRSGESTIRTGLQGFLTSPLCILTSHTYFSHFGLSVVALQSLIPAYHHTSSLSLQILALHPHHPQSLPRFPLLHGTALVLLIWYLCEGHISAASFVGPWGVPVCLYSLVSFLESHRPWLYSCKGFP